MGRRFNPDNWLHFADRGGWTNPFAADAVMAFIGERAISGTESWDGVTYRRSLDLPGGPGVINLVANDDHVAARLALTSWTDLAAAVQRIRRLLDLDADPTAVDEALDTLKKAWDAGFRDATWVRRDPDLVTLHGDADFERLYPAAAGA